MKWLWLILLFSCSTPQTKYAAKADLRGMAHGFMYHQEHQGVEYYFQFEKPEDAQWLKLNLFLVNNTKKEVKLKSQDFALLIDGVTLLPQSKLQTIKKFEAYFKDASNTYDLPILFHDADAIEDKQRLLKNEFIMVERYMLEDEYTLIPQAPTKMYTLYLLGSKELKQFVLKLPGDQPPIPVKRD